MVLSVHSISRTVYFDYLDRIVILQMRPPGIRTAQIVRAPHHLHQHRRPRRWAQNGLREDVPIENLRVG
jgi:hypothetical protein